MKTRFTKFAFSLTAFGFVLQTHAQGTFQNLDFEEANLPVLPLGQHGGNVAITDGLPGWNGYLGANQQPLVLHNNFTIGTASISILGPLSEDSLIKVIEGNYTVFLQPGSNPATGNPFDHVGAAIAQAGVIPSGARSLMFFGSLTPVFGQLQITLDGQALSFFTLSDGPNYTVYGSDISAFAGQLHELRFTAPDIGIGPNNVYLDSISFSPVGIPEPSGFGLLALGSLLLGWRFWKR